MEPKDILYHPAVGMKLQNTNGSVFEITGFHWDRPINGIRPSRKILKQLFKNGTHGEKAYLYTDEEIINQIQNQKVKIIYP